MTRITDYVHEYAVAAPDRDAVVFGDERITYAELERQVDAFAKALLAAGITKGDRVAMLSTSRPEYWVAFLATAGIGAIWVGLSPKQRLEELRYLVGDCQPRLIVAMTEFEGRSYLEDISALDREFSFVEKIVTFAGAGEGATELDTFLAGGEEVSDEDYASAAKAVDRLDPALIVYTSGSTGRPKGAILSHYGLSYGSRIQTTHFGVEHPKLVVNFPINHVACVADTCCTTLVKGGTVIFQERFDPAATLEAVQNERASLWGGVPTMLQMAMALPDFDDYDLSSVELVLWGGAAMPREGVEKLGKLGARRIAMYGMTETSAHMTYTEADASVDVLSETIGKPDAAFSCRIVDENASVCRTGEAGELQFKGEYLMLGYYNRPDATAASLTDDGWFRTGDLGFTREDGNIQLVGRRSEMYKSGGYNVYPREIEIAIEEHAGVELAAVVAVPDELYQEVGHAHVVAKPGATVTEEALRSYCKERLTNYKVPKRFHIRESLPRLPVGKIDKKALARESREDM